MVRETLPPSPRQMPLAWAIAGIISGAAIVLAGLWWLHRDPSVPIVVEATRSGFVDATTWRVESDVKFASACSAIIVSRSFAPVEGGNVRNSRPTASYIDGVGAVPYSYAVSDGERRTAWHEYSIEPDWRGQHIVVMHAHGCANGFSGEAYRAAIEVRP